MLKLLWLTLAAVPASPDAGPPPAPASATAHSALWALFDEEWDWAAAAFPETATENGDDRFDDRLTDWSADAIAARKLHEREMLARAVAFPAAALAAGDQLNLELFRDQLQLAVEGQRFPFELLQLDQLDSPPAALAELARAIPRVHPKDLENFLARLRAVPAQLDQQLALLREGLARGITPPQVTLAEVPKLLANHAPDDPTRSPLYEAAFGQLPASIPPGDQERLRAQAKALLSEKVIPAYRKLAAFVASAYLPKARQTLGASALPDGEAWYRYDIAAQTTTDLSAEAIHALGLAEVERLQKEMDDVQLKTGFKGDRAAFFAFLKSDSRFFYGSPSELLRGFRDIAKRIDPELARHFATLPRLTYGVAAMPDYQAKTSPAAFYEPGSPDVGRPGYFMANTYDLKARPKWAMEDLTLHEAVPGHHFQFARAQELGDLPRFRRYGSYNAFVEGWALYCESLGDELGLYTDPYSKFGQLSAEMWRAVRLVVDTGLHAKGWTRAQALAFFHDHTGQSDLNAKVEVDRYIVWPGQALGYKLGQLAILRLRGEAEKALGEKFDERQFHDAVIGSGAVPLPVLEKLVRAWIVRQ